MLYTLNQYNIINLLYLNYDPDNHDGVITHLELDVLECKIKWALGSITMNKASGGDGIPVELFQILKNDAVKVLYSICQPIWKLNSGHRNNRLVPNKKRSMSRLSIATLLI